MKLFNCYYPKVLKNPYTGEIITAKCGKCAACRNARIANWISKLDVESSCHKYTVFFTLTYNDQNIPQVVRLRKTDYDGPAYIDSETGELIDLRTINANFTQYDKDYIRNNKVLNYASKRDFQNFIKRLRYYFDQCDKGARLRYYIVSEIGPTTFRGHGHGLLFFDSEKCADQIQVLLRKSWKFGVLYDPHSVSGSAASYCAAYLNGLAKLPKVYLHPSLRPFAIFSKHPAIGTLLPNLQDIRKVFDEKPMRIRRFDVSTKSFKDIPLPSSLEARLYPRCQRFSQLSPDDRIKVYDFIRKLPPTGTTRDHVEFIKSNYLVRGENRIEECDFYTRYFYEISHKDVRGLRIVPDKSSTLLEYKNYPFLPHGPISTPFYAFKTTKKQFCEDSLYRLVRTLKRVDYQSTIFGISIEDYVNNITDYYNKKNAYRLKEDYKFQDEYFKTHPSSDFKYFDYSFLKRVSKKEPSQLSAGEKFYLSHFHILSDTLKTLPYSIRNHKEYANLRMLHDKISFDLVKTKKNNDYATARKNKRGEVVLPLNI